MTKEDIHDLYAHPDAVDLREHDHPRQHLRSWRAYLTAKAWIGPRLGCFFTGQDGEGERFVLLFNGGNAYRSAVYGEDMRCAVIGDLYEIDAFVPRQHEPIVDRAERLSGSPRG